MKTNQKLDPGLRNRSAQHGKDGKRHFNLPRIDFNRRHLNRSLPTQKLLQLLQNEAPGFWELAEVVGKWVWIQFDGSQPRSITAELSELGFHWNRKRKLWQHPCGVFTTRNTFRRPFHRYFPADLNPA